MRKIQLNYPEQYNKDGVHSFCTTDWPRDTLYRSRESNYEIGLKVFKDPFVPLEDFRWKHVKLLDATKVQNLFWFHGLAPRVFDIVEVKMHDGKHWAQVVELLPETERGPLERAAGELMQEVRKMYGIRQISVDPNKHHNYKKYMVDFSHHEFADETYKNYLKKELVDNAGWGSNPATYQSVPELTTVGQRNLEGRLKAYDFDSIDFNGKTVLDYGCSSGMMSRECLRRGAEYVVGLELPAPAKVAFEVSNYLGDFNIDYYGDNFRHEPDNNVYKKIVKYTGLLQFDIVLYLSVMQLKKPDYLPAIVGETFYLEGHTADKEETYRPWLEENFNKVEFLGASNDHSIRPVFRCTK